VVLFARRIHLAATEAVMIQGLIIVVIAALIVQLKVMVAVLLAVMKDAQIPTLTTSIAEDAGLFVQKVCSVSTEIVLILPVIIYIAMPVSAINLGRIVKITFAMEEHVLLQAINAPPMQIAQQSVVGVLVKIF